MHAQSLFRKEFLDVLRPFNNAEAAAVHIVVESDVKGLGCIVDAVEIKMIKRLAGCCPVFVNNGECRRAHRILIDPEDSADCGSEGGLSRSHRGEEGYDSPVPDLFEKGPGSPGKMSRVLDEYFVFQLKKPYSDSPTTHTRTCLSKVVYSRSNSSS